MFVCMKNHKKEKGLKDPSLVTVKVSGHILTKPGPIIKDFCV